MNCESFTVSVVSELVLVLTVPASSGLEDDCPQAVKRAAQNNSLMMVLISKGFYVLICY